MPDTTPAARAETLGSLLQPESLLTARQRRQAGDITPAQLVEVEEHATLQAIALQEEIGLDVITDGEFHRTGWVNTFAYLDGIEQRPAPRSYPASASTRPGAPSTSSGNTVVARISEKPGLVIGEEFEFLAANAHSPTKYTLTAPSYHRRVWSDEVSPISGYESCEEFITDVRDWLGTVAARLVAQGCTYLQLDAPNYGSLCDPVTRQFHAEAGHDLDTQIAFDAALDSSVFDGLDVTGALHVCRGNGPGGQPHSSGGYDILAEQLFPNLDLDVVLLEYDSDRSGELGPISLVRPGTVAVLGLLTTKSGVLESRDELLRRVEEAASLRPLDELAISTQCGFASAANAPMTDAEQRAKLERVVEVARSVWN